MKPRPARSARVRVSRGDLVVFDKVLEVAPRPILDVALGAGGVGALFAFLSGDLWVAPQIAARIDLLDGQLLASPFLKPPIELWQLNEQLLHAWSLANSFLAVGVVALMSVGYRWFRRRRWRALTAGSHPSDAIPSDVLSSIALITTSSRAIELHRPDQLVGTVTDEQGRDAVYRSPTTQLLHASERGRQGLRLAIREGSRVLAHAGDLEIEVIGLKSK